MDWCQRSRPQIRPAFLRMVSTTSTFRLHLSTQAFPRSRRSGSSCPRGQHRACHQCKKRQSCRRRCQQRGDWLFSLRQVPPGTPNGVWSGTRKREREEKGMKRVSWVFIVSVSSVGRTPPTCSKHVPNQGGLTLKINPAERVEEPQEHQGRLTSEPPEEQRREQMSPGLANQHIEANEAME